MRLDMLEEGRGLRPIQRLFATIIKKLGGNFMPPPVIILSYRRELFGKQFVKAEQQALREATYWSKADAELMAAFVSSQNACRY
ncbi:MAG: hypothetical protein AAF702_27170 [Chloroflexota bacterium]